MLSTKKLSDLAFPLLALTLFVYVFARAILIPITNDEAYSFHNMKQFWYAEAFCTGNTHWLNSMAIKTAILFQLEQVPAIRWLSVLSVFVFLGLGCWFLRTQSAFTARMFFFALVFLNPYVLDYFTIARGYAPALMLQALSLILLFYSFNRQKQLPGFLSLFSAGLSALSNFSFSFYFAAFCLVYFSIHYYTQQKSFYRNKFFYRDLAFVLGVFFLVFRALLFITRCSYDVMGAGTMSLQESIRVLAQGLFTGSFQPSQEVLDLLATCIALLIVAAGVWGIRKNTKASNPHYYFASWILLLQLGAVFIGHYVFHQVLPAFRSALFLFPLTAFCLFHFLLYLPVFFRLRQTTISLLSLLLVFNFFSSCNFNQVFDYALQADENKSFQYLEKIKAKRVGLSSELYGSYRNYFQMTEKYKFSFFAEEINSKKPTGIRARPCELKSYDHLLLLPPYDLSSYKGCDLRFKALKLFPNTGALVLEVY